MSDYLIQIYEYVENNGEQWDYFLFKAYSEKEIKKMLYHQNAAGVGHQKGWECPKCGKIYAPMVFGCIQCNRKIDDYRKGVCQPGGSV